jgi:hypothetical protein
VGVIGVVEWRAFEKSQATTPASEPGKTAETTTTAATVATELPTAATVGETTASLLGENTYTTASSASNASVSPPTRRPVSASTPAAVPRDLSLLRSPQSATTTCKYRREKCTFDHECCGGGECKAGRCCGPLGVLCTDNNECCGITSICFKGACQKCGSSTQHDPCDPNSPCCSWNECVRGTCVIRKD